MAKHNKFGAQGENIAINYLIKKKYLILKKNWMYKHKEIDIIAEKDNLLVIVEVKSRTNTIFETLNEAVSMRKQKFIIEATEAYIIEKDIDKEVRFDIILVIQRGNKYDIEHFEDAFQPLVNQ